ncbi:hypothetical protein P280DRAFT_469640 [Massarina eburnea CBS 473.64]|uniref:Uncharacterized protein n=1 Tax=Massarina eburnea CBS 473.64 TaxID=1395130 RepID=A0A6A6RZI4_9PLEO|nr:hypothetical protein P280DRAFT_469640 [Massarina eburnea CBS 473.64]
MRSLVEEYWGEQDPAHPIRETHISTRQIRQAAAAEPSGSFIIGGHADANEFSEWLTGQLEDPTNLVWQRQFETLFKLDTRPQDTCLGLRPDGTICGRVTEGTPASDNYLTIPWHLVDTCETLDHAIHEAFRDTA